VAVVSARYHQVLIEKQQLTAVAANTVLVAVADSDFKQAQALETLEVRGVPAAPFTQTSAYFVTFHVAFW
jgi:hypothetical protein